MKDQFLAFLKAFFKGFGQIMLQNNAWTGIFFISAILYDSPLMGLAGTVANVTAMITAKLMKFDEEYILDGLFSFNATLYGIAIVFYFQQNVWIWMALIIGSVVTTLLMGVALKKKLPVFTFPFIVVTWAALYILSIPGLELNTIPENFVDIEEMDDFLIEGHAFGQVIFQGSLLTGLVFFIGVFINKPMNALYGCVAVIISIYISHHGHESQEMINHGTFSFNAVLCGIALSGQRVRDGVYVLIAVIIATYFDIFLVHHGWATLTFPFVFAMWIMVPIQNFDKWLVSKLDSSME